jgi:DNA polymerase-4/DNA polymerase V
MPDDEVPLTLQTLPRAIMHIDGNAFFASCEQSRKPALQGRPVITGKKRDIASSMGYEAKARGVTRGMRLQDIKRLCPDAIILPSDYETYSLLSKHLFAIVRRYIPDVEEYSIDEALADLTGLRRPHRMSYESMAQRIKHELEVELGFTFSVGLAPSKVLAKIASKWQKPSGLTAIPGQEIHRYLKDLPVENVWGIGPQTTPCLRKHKVRTALEFARKDEAWVTQHLTEPFHEIWQELHGTAVFELETAEHKDYASIQKFKTCTPASTEKAFVYALLVKNIENACQKARRYHLAAKRVVIILRRQSFQDIGLQIDLTNHTNIPNEIVSAIAGPFDEVYEPDVRYRATGVILLQLAEECTGQLDLFGEAVPREKLTKLYECIDALRMKYGKHTVCLGASFLAHTHAQHDGERGHLPERQRELLPGETSRKHLGIPMFLGEVT